MHAYHSRILPMTTIVFIFRRATCQRLPEVCADPLGRNQERKSFSAPPHYLPLSPVPKPFSRHFARKTLFFQPTAGIPSLDLILESARDDRNVAKKRMVSVVTKTTPAIVFSNVGSQVPHLQSLPPLSVWKRLHVRTPCTQQTRACVCGSCRKVSYSSRLFSHIKFT